MTGADTAASIGLEEGDTIEVFQDFTMLNLSRFKHMFKTTRSYRVFFTGPVKVSVSDYILNLIEKVLSVRTT